MHQRLDFFSQKYPNHPFPQKNLKLYPLKEAAFFTENKIEGFFLPLELILALIFFLCWRSLHFLIFLSLIRGQRSFCFNASLTNYPIVSRFHHYFTFHSNIFYFSLLEIYKTYLEDTQNTILQNNCGFSSFATFC